MFLTNDFLHGSQRRTRPNKSPRTPPTLLQLATCSRTHTDTPRKKKNSPIDESLPCFHQRTEDCSPDEKTVYDNEYLEDLLQKEGEYKHLFPSFDTIHGSKKFKLRQTVLHWMVEMCLEKRCEEDVILLAINYLDRVLVDIPTPSENDLKSFGAICIVIASKLRDACCKCVGLSIKMIPNYLEVSKSCLAAYEKQVAKIVKWDLSVLTPLHFLESLLICLPIIDLHIDEVKMHAKKLIMLTVHVKKFSKYSPSMIAAASIAAASDGYMDLSDSCGILFILIRVKLVELVEFATILSDVKKCPSIISNFEEDPTIDDDSNMVVSKWNIFAGSSLIAHLIKLTRFLISGAQMLRSLFF